MSRAHRQDFRDHLFRAEALIAANESADGFLPWLSRTVSKFRDSSLLLMLAGSWRALCGRVW